jgi:hypothetical protein
MRAPAKIDASKANRIAFRASPEMTAEIMDAMSAFREHVPEGFDVTLSTTIKALLAYALENHPLTKVKP